MPMTRRYVRNVILFILWVNGVKEVKGVNEVYGVNEGNGEFGIWNGELLIENWDLNYEL